MDSQSSEETTESESEEELTSSDEEVETDRSFGEQYQVFLDTEIPPGQCPILCFSKIPSKIDSLIHEESEKQKEKKHLAAARKQLLNQLHVSTNQFDQEKEKKLRKSAKSITIQLFQSLSQVQKKPQLFDSSSSVIVSSEEPEKVTEKEESSIKKTDDFLSILTAAALRPKQDKK